MPGEIINISSHHSATHIFAFWDGFELNVKHQVGKIFLQSPEVQYATIVQTGVINDPVKKLGAMGFGAPILVKELRGLQVLHLHFVCPGRG